MALQTRNLWMASLGVLDDDPVNDLQPALGDGIHLRWAFARELGFPWHGYYLFRRRARTGPRSCLGSFSTLVQAGAGQNSIVLPIGVLSSDRPITVTDDFPPPGAREVDLAGRDHLRLTLPPTTPAWRAEVTIGFRQPLRGAAPARAVIEVRALFGDTPLAVRRVSGTAGQVVTTVLELDAITAIELSGGTAALIDLCVVPVGAGVSDGWQPIPGFTYPLRLPVAHPDYPPAPPLPNLAAARASALARVSYGPTTPWLGQGFSQLHGVLRQLVDDGPPPGGEAMVDRSVDVAGTPPPPEETGGQVVQLRQAPLDLVLLGSLHPAVAQMLGLYWLDAAVAPGQAFDYLLLADHDGSLGGTAASALAWMVTPDWDVVDGFVAFNKRLAPAPPLAAPGRPRAYSLPGTTLAVDGGDELLDATNNAGLVWNRPLTDGVLQPGAPVLYHVWRADLGDVDTPASPGAEDFEPLTARAPILVGAEPPLGLASAGVPGHPAHWPPFSLHYVDRGRPDGWYAYRVGGIDIFGRHSPTSASAEWRQWEPVPDPRPWYYLDPPGGQVVHADRIRLLDKLPPPPPTAVEAFALDPDDPTVLRDAAYQAWRETLTEAERESVIGLRVRWRWNEAQMRQAPDTREFRVYVHPAPVNTLSGRVAAVTPDGATESLVATGIPHTQPAGAFDGLSVRIGTDSFRVLESEASSPLRLRVANIGAEDEIRPEARAGCSVPIPPGHNLHTEFGDAPPWDARVLVVSFDEHVTVEAGGEVRRYEAFLPAPASPDRAGLALATSLAEPMAYALVGVTAADDRTHTPDHRGDPDRFGNESGVGGPATVFRVRREQPPAPEVPPDDERRFASPADYHARSYYTYRWLPADELRTHVFRALDDAVFAADLALRPRPALSPADASAFPPEAVDPRWDGAKRTQVAAELNALNALDPGDRAAAAPVYRSLSNDALRVLAGLPGTEAAFTQITIQPLDPAESDPSAPGGLRWGRVGPDVAPGSLGPGELAYVDTLDGRATNRWYYRSGHVDAVHNVGPLSLATPPVWLPDVVPPRTPTVTRLTAGDRRITVEWASNREPDLAEYRVYRADDAAAARDVRAMALVHTASVEAGDPAERPAVVSWTDDPVPGVRDFWYRIVAVDRAGADPREGGGNASPPSPALRARAFDQTAPVPPAIEVAEWVRVDPSDAVFPWASLAPEREPAVRLTWEQTPDLRLLVQVQGESNDGFAPASAWLAPGTTSFVHRTTRTFESNRYRLKAVSAAGNANEVFLPIDVPSPS